MREIKFRAWEKEIHEDGEVYGGEMYYSEECDGKRRAGFTIKADSAYSNEQFVWMQYTGLKDSQGKEIYEGDVVKIHHEKYKNSKDMAVIEWQDRCGRFIANRKNMAEDCTMTMSEYFEVIGNIYENKDLLETT